MSVAVALTAMPVIALPSSVSADERPQPRPRAIALSLPTSGMASVPVTFRVTTTPGPGARLLTAAIQVRSQLRGFVTLRKVPMARSGEISGPLVSKRPGKKEYRAILVSPTGRIVAVTGPRTVTWTRLTHEVSLDCATSTSPIDVDVPCDITVTPPVRLDRMVASLQVRGATDWVTLESFRVPASGRLMTDVVGRAAGASEYRVLLLRDAAVIAESPTVTVAYG